jgi:hypothetical protein
MLSPAVPVASAATVKVLPLVYEAVTPAAAGQAAIVAARFDARVEVLLLVAK